MTASDSLNVTELLVAWSGGDREALKQLVPMVRKELHRLAEHQIRLERRGHTLQPTALVNEAYVRLIGQQLPDLQSRAHFLGVCAQVMRQVLVDYSRKHRSAKRGAGNERLTLDEALAYVPERSSELLALDDALTRLSRAEERKARVVELRFFGGLSNAEIADLLHVAENTVIRDWAFARAWLQNELRKRP